MRDKKGDIVICSTNWTGNNSFDLVVEDRYEVLNHPEPLSGSGETSWFFNVRNIKTGKISYFTPARLFISLEVYRDFKISEILK
jgi:hypothetical protein